MPRITSNGLELEVETHGDPLAPTVLLIMGLAAQLTRWPEAFIDAFVNAGFRVVTFDNRDIGLSEKLETSYAPPPLLATALNRVGLTSLVAPYKLTDMADDARGVLDALNIERAHIVGASMGGMIAQILCAEQAPRAMSFTAIMSSTNNPDLPRAHPTIAKEVFFARRRSTRREDVIEDTLRIWSLIGTKDSGRDPDEFRQQIADSVDRNTSPDGIRRQIAAIVATRDLRGWTRRITAPSLVLHGSDDPLVPVDCGRDIAASIPDARLEIIEGMGHDLPPKHVTQLANHVLEHLCSAEKKAASERAA